MLCSDWPTSFSIYFLLSCFSIRLPGGRGLTYILFCCVLRDSHTAWIAVVCFAVQLFGPTIKVFIINDGVCSLFNQKNSNSSSVCCDSKGIFELGFMVAEVQESKQI